MTAASALIGGLGNERVRWTEQSKEFKDQIGRLVGDVLMATAFLSYSGPYNQDFRNLLNRNWTKELKNRRIPLSASLNLIDMLTDPVTIGEWGLQGLPNDDLSVQNGIIVTKASRYPLLIDPQTQGKAWIKNREHDHELQLTNLNHKYFRQHLEDALSLGRPLIIEDINEELDPALDNILEKNFIKIGSTYKVKVGDKEIDVMDGFVLYITTKLPNPSYTPEISARTSIIDFTVTMKGLEDQLLGRVILTEKNELEAERVKLVEDVTANKRKMKELEDNLLFRLTSTQGSLVDDEDLINVLNVTKHTSEEVSQKLIIADETQTKITEAREEYRPVATRGSILYFLITEMSLVNVMYQTSLKQFLDLFDKSMEKSSKSPIPARRIQNIIEYMTYEVFKYNVRGLYSTDKMTFTVILALKIDMQAGKIKHDEFGTFIKGGASLDLNAVQPKPCSWITDATWLNLVELSNLHQFSGILDQVGRSQGQWKQWFSKDEPESEVIPDGYDQNLDVFHRLLLVRCWCPDRTISQALNYVADTLGDKYAEGVILDIEKVWQESEAKSPLVGLLSMGSDPTASIEALAKKHKIDCRAISMGQGQDVHARRLMNQFTVNGGWVLLQNCHLSLDYIEEVMDQVVETENIHPTFRLWVTTEMHPKFPITFLQMSLKFTNEPPQGIKAGLKRTYAGITQDFLDITSMPQWKPMLFSVAFLHTCVQERRKFGPLGWNIPYEFNTADYNASVQFVQNHLDDMDPKKGVTWSCVQYMFGEIQYGGRVTDDYDKRLLNTFCKVWINETIFSPDFRFHTGYTIPKATKVGEYTEYISNLPNHDTPEAFGLHPNADITYQRKTAENVLGTILDIQPKDSSGGSGETREAKVYRLANDMLDKLPSDYLPHEVKDRMKKMGQLQPMNIFLKQELDRMQRVISTVRNTLIDLKLAIDGTIIMSETLREALDSMFDAKIPQTWLKISWESSTIGFWFTELIERNTQFHAWCFDGRPNTFWMTGFFNPQGFLTAMRQEVTRAHKGWALDTVVLCNDVTRYTQEDNPSAPAEGVYVYGLSLEGAGWDKRGCKLIEPKNKILFDVLPIIHIKAENSTQGHDPRMYVCPIYKKPKRTDLTYIAAVTLKTNQTPDKWILRGVALLCDIK